MPTADIYQLGATVVVVSLFIAYLTRRDAANAKREAATQTFFAKLFTDNKDSAADLVRVIRELIKEFQEHSTETRTAIAKMDERTQPLADRRARGKATGD